MVPAGKRKGNARHCEEARRNNPSCRNPTFYQATSPGLALGSTGAIHISRLFYLIKLVAENRTGCFATRVMTGTTYFPRPSMIILSVYSSTRKSMAKLMFSMYRMSNLSRSTIWATVSA